MKSLGIVLNSRDVSGAEKRIMRLSYYLNTHEGLETHVFVPRILFALIEASPELAHIPREFGDRVHCYSSPVHANATYLVARIAWMFQLYTLWRAIKKHPTTLLEGSCGSPRHLYALSKLRQLPKNVLIEITSPDVVNDILARKSMSSWILSDRVKSMFFVSRSTFDKFKAAVPEDLQRRFESKSTYAPIPFYVAPGLDRVPKEKLIVYASRFIERKNPLLFAKAAREFLIQRPDWRVTMLGTGPLTTQVREVLADAIASGQATVEWMDDIYPVLRSSSIYISVIRKDNFPSQSIMEAMACENVLVCNDVGQTGKFFNGKNGVLIDAAAENLLATLLHLSSETALEGMGKASREHLLKDFNPGIYIASLFATYRAAGLEVSKA